jgi:PAS domain S-box-containing protein
MKTELSKMPSSNLPTRVSLDSLEAVVCLDPQFVIVLANRAYASLVRVAEDVLIGQPFLEVHPDANGTLIKKLRHLLAKDEPARFFEDYCITLKKWLLYKLTPQEYGYALTVKDITEQKYRTLAKEQSDEQIRLLLEQSPVGMGRLSLDGRWIGVNSLCAEIIGTAKETLLGRSFQEICLQDSADKEMAQFAMLLRKERSVVKAEKQILQADGTPVWVSLKISLVTSDTGRPCFFLIVMDDIDERKEIEESLQFALDAARMGTWDFDAINNNTRRSPRFDEIFGYKNIARNWTYQDFLSHIHPEDHGVAEKAFRDALLSGQNFALEVRIRWPDWSVHWISLRGRVYLNRQGRAIQMAGTILDITDQKVREGDLQQAREAAEAANREKSSFLANMSHEIRTPLGAILGFTDMLTDPDLKKEDYLNYLKIILRNGRSLAVLVDDILDLSKVEAGHLDVEKIAVDIPDLIENIGTLFMLKAEAKGLKLTITSDQKLPTHLITDPARLRQILLNIVGNAIKFTSAGEVSIHVSLSNNGVSGTKSKQWLTVVVKDTGPGMSKQEVERLFRPFTQADSSTTRKFGGTGLGLALSRKLAKALGGDVVLSRSAPGQGAEFTITVLAEPVAVKPQPVPVAETAPATKPHPAATAKTLEGLQILVADDSPDNRLLISRILHKGGANIDLADDGNQAVEKVRRNDYDVVVMDMQMPNLDGYGATRQLRDEGFTGPIVALTANAMRNDRERCLEAGCSDYLPKPVDPLQLYRVLGDLTHAL